jgi:hypothetical protein
MRLPYAVIAQLLPQNPAISPVGAEQIISVCRESMPKLLLDVHAATLSCGRRSLKTRPSPRRECSEWDRVGARAERPPDRFVYSSEKSDRLLDRAKSRKSSSPKVICPTLSDRKVVVFERTYFRTLVQAAALLVQVPLVYREPWKPHVCDCLRRTDQSFPTVTG